MRRALRCVVVPLLGFVVCYFILTYPQIKSFTTEFYCDRGDGPQMVWNLWWTDFAITQLHQSPFHTGYLHYPHGVTLLLHTLTPYNGLLSIPLSRVFSPVVTYNTLVVLAFTLAGLTAFWLALDVTRAYWPSLAAGYAFAFCSSHFAHAGGHLQTISNQWLPLFMLLTLRLFARPTVVRSLAAASVLFVVLLCDHYLFLFCSLAIVVMLAHRIFESNGLRPWRTAQGARAIIAFILATMLTSGPLVSATLRASSGDPVGGSHDPRDFSADLLGLLVPGWAWHFNELTRWSWGTATVSNYPETSVSVGLAVLVAAVVGWKYRKHARIDSAGLWATLAITFAILSLGPTLTVMSKPILSPMPYRWLEAILPPLRLAGCPARMMVVAQLAICVLAAAGLKALWTARTPESARALLIGAFALAMVIESQPRLQATFDPTPPAWVTAVRDLPVPGPLLDARTGGDSLGLYYQTIHHRPIALGEIARIPESVARKTRHVVDAFEADRFDELFSMGFRMMVVGASRPKFMLPLLYEDREVRVYELTSAGEHDGTTAKEH